VNVGSRKLTWKYLLFPTDAHKETVDQLLYILFLTLPLLVRALRTVNINNGLVMISILSVNGFLCVIARDSGIVLNANY